MSDNIEKLAKELYYMNPNMIEFLIIENLALKSLLHEKGIINPEDYKKHQEKSSELVHKRVNDQIVQWKSSNSKIYDVLKNLQDKANRDDLHSKDDVVVS